MKSSDFFFDFQSTSFQATTYKMFPMFSAHAYVVSCPTSTKNLEWYILNNEYRKFPHGIVNLLTCNFQ